MGRTILKFVLLASLLPLKIQASVLDLSQQAMKDVVKIARAINVVQPRLDDGKYLEYALGIYRASMKYNIEPSVLIAITQQETGFREGLPEGAAGEQGICQILKSWLNNPKFKAEFKTATLKDFKKTSKSFMFAAWILLDLKKRITSGSLPYWSFYNANKFHNRFKYFLYVNKYVAMLKKNEHLFNDTAIAAADSKPLERMTEPTLITSIAPPAPAPEPLPAAKVEKLVVAAVAAPPEPQPVAPTEPQILTGAPLVSTASAAPSGLTQWIPDALKKVQLKNQGKQASNNRKVSPALLRAAAQLEVDGGVFEKIQD